VPGAAYVCVPLTVTGWAEPVGDAVAQLGPVAVPPPAAVPSPQLIDTVLGSGSQVAFGELGQGPKTWSNTCAVTGTPSVALTVGVAGGGADPAGAATTSAKARARATGASTRTARHFRSHLVLPIWALILHRPGRASMIHPPPAPVNSPRSHIGLDFINVHE
jgi:hypothetical protein